MNDSTPAPFDAFSHGVSDTAGEISNPVMVLLSINELCGDGVVSGNEDCDAGNLVAGDCCSANCQFEVAGSSCNDGDTCTTVDVYDASGVCLAGPPRVCDDSTRVPPTAATPCKAA